MPSRWSLFRPGALHFHCWEDSAVVFNHANSDTHSISLLGYESLTTLESAPDSSARAIVQELADVFTDMNPQESEQLVEAALLRLQDIGLVTCVAS